MKTMKNNAKDKATCASVFCGPFALAFQLIEIINAGIENKNPKTEDTTHDEVSKTNINASLMVSEPLLIDSVTRKMKEKTVIVINKLTIPRKIHAGIEKRFIIKYPPSYRHHQK